MSEEKGKSAVKAANDLFPHTFISQALDNQSKRFREAFMLGYKHSQSQIETLEKENATAMVITQKLLEECEKRKQENEEYEIAISRLLKGDYDINDISIRFPHL